MERDAAILQASRDRLRPILMTTLRVRRRHDPARAVERRRLGHQPRDRLRHHRRPVARAGADAGRDAGGLLALRRRVEGPVPAMEATARPAAATATGLLLALGLSVPQAAAQAVTPAGQTSPVIRLTRNEAIRMAIANNPDLAADRLEPGDQRRARRGSQGRVPADAVRAASSATASSCRRRISSPAIVGDRPTPGRARRARAAAAVGRRHLRRVVQHRADDDQQPDLHLHSVDDVVAPGDLLAAAAARFQDRSGAGADRHRGAQPDHRGHPAAGARRPHLGRRRSAYWKLVRRGRRSTCSSGRWISRWSSSGTTARASTSGSRRRSTSCRRGPKSRSAART